MSGSLSKKLRKIIRSEYRNEMRKYYNLSFWTRLKLAYTIIFRIRPKDKKYG